MIFNNPENISLISGNYTNPNPIPVANGRGVYPLTIIPAKKARRQILLNTTIIIPADKNLKIQPALPKSGAKMIWTQPLQQMNDRKSFFLSVL